MFHMLDGCELEAYSIFTFEVSLTSFCWQPRSLLQIFHARGLIKNLEGKNEGTLSFTAYQERAYEFNARYWVDNLGGGGPVFSRRFAMADPMKLPPGED
jgi:hypothetical protein